MSGEGIFVHKCLIFLNQEEYKPVRIALCKKHGEIVELLGILIDPESRSEYTTALKKLNEIFELELRDYLNQIGEINLSLEHTGCNYDIDPLEVNKQKSNALAFESVVRKFIKNMEFSLNGMIHG